tara:strand:+ start:337 stop:507 length:171 start_codon:yes stop_codon:yes gene_type:complete
MSKEQVMESLQEVETFYDKDIQRSKIQQLKKHCESLSVQNIDALIDLAKSWKQFQQ